MIKHIGVQILHSANLGKSSERVAHNKSFILWSQQLFVTRSEDFLKAGRAQQEIYIMKSEVVRDPLRGFSQICRMQKNLNTMLYHFSN